MSDRLRHPTHPARLIGLLTIGAALGISLISALALLAPASWIFELLTHFRLQYLAVQLPLLALLAWRRSWGLAALCAAFALVNAATAVAYWPRAPLALAAEPAIKLMTVNLYGRNHDHTRFIELARRESPDVMLLAEVTPSWARALGTLAAEYPHLLVSPRQSAYGIALLSRLPLLEPRVVDLLSTPAIDTSLRLPDGRIARLVGVHLRAPSSAAGAAERNAQLSELAALLAGEAGPLIVTGDFNATPYSPLLSDWLERTGLEDARRGRGFGATWPTFFPILGIPIDHCLISEHFTVTEQYQGPAFGSDHYPVLTRLFLRGSQNLF